MVLLEMNQSDRSFSRNFYIGASGNEFGLFEFSTKNNEIKSFFFQIVI